MFNIAEQWAKALTVVVEAQLAGVQALGLAPFDDGGLSLSYTERQVDAFRASLAAGTVAARELLAIPRGDAQ